MKKWIAFILALVCVFALVACSDNPLAKNVRVFKTENITRITFYLERYADREFEVPSQYMAEITAWLGSFTINDMGKVYEQAAGANHTTVKIEYSDGTVIQNGLSTTWYDGVEYEMLHDDPPECYDALFQSAE